MRKNEYDRSRNYNDDYNYSVCSQDSDEKITSLT